MNDITRELRTLEWVREESLNAAGNLKRFVATETALQIVTVESLTAGMISKTLMDVPRYGAALYGGFIVYDTDAKRQMVNVLTKGVYSEKTALEMATGALQSTRATLAIAVTGDAMPDVVNLDALGVVYIAVAVQFNNIIHAQTMTLTTCTAIPEMQTLCNQWKRLRRDEFPAAQIVAMTADIIRMYTVATACRFALQFIQNLKIDLKGKNFGVAKELYDQECHSSKPLYRHLNIEAPFCNPKDESPVQQPRRRSARRQIQRYN